MSLRDILDAATPGPWHVDYGWDEGPNDGPSPHGWVAPHGAYADRATNQLIALAPELAVLCLDMGEALAYWVVGNEFHEPGQIETRAESHRQLLARLDRIGEK